MTREVEKTLSATIAIGLIDHVLAGNRKPNPLHVGHHFFRASGI